MTEISFINVGYGEAILIKHNNRWALIDGGSSLPQEFVGNRISLKEYLKQQNIDSLEFVVVTHIHEDHVCGINEILNSVEIKHFYLPYLPNIVGSKDIELLDDQPFNLYAYAKAFNGYKEILTFAKENNIKCTNVALRRHIKPFGDHFRIDVVEPSYQNTLSYCRLLEILSSEADVAKQWDLIKFLDAESNDHSLVTILRVDNNSLILTADNCPSNWDDKTFLFLRNGNVLKLPHHGQADAVDTKLLSNLNAEYVVTSTSSDRRHNSANKIVYDQIKGAKKDVEFLFTDETEYPPYFINKRSNLQALTFVIKDKKIELKM